MRLAIGYTLLLAGALVASWGVFSVSLGGVMLAVGIAAALGGIATVIWHSKSN